MASAIPRKATFISLKLKFLNDQGDHLISAVGDYINNIIAAGDSWTPGGDNNMDYQELCQMIDTAVEFLCEKCEELSGGSVGVAANQLSCNQPGQTSQSITATASTLAASDRQAVVPLASTATTSYRQPAAPLASTVTTSYRQSTESVQPADEMQLKPVLAKIAVIEEAMYSLRSRTEKVAEQQSCIDQELKEVLSELSKSDQKHSSRFKQVKQQISDISETQNAIEQEQKTRLQSLEEELQKVSTAQNRLKGEIESQAELVEKLVHIPNLLESVKENVDALDDRIDGINVDCRNKHEDIETEMRDLADKVIAKTQSVEVLSEGQVQKTTLLKELKARLQTLEAGGGRNVKDVQKQAGKGEANFQILCQMFNDRLRPLEQLRTCLNERAKRRDYNVSTLYQLIQKVAAMSLRLQQLEVKSSRTRCGFSALTRFTEEDDNTIRRDNTTYCNVGENFNVDSGIFTAPVDGLYVVSITLRLFENEPLSVYVEYKQSLDQISSTTVCCSKAVTKDTTACDVGVVDMKAGDVLYSCVGKKEKHNYNKWVCFSCFLLG